MSSTKPPGGTRDFLPDDVRRRDHVIAIIRRTYERYGFEPLETPAFENIETLLGKYGDEGNKLIFKILRRGEREAGGEADLALRYDLTVPLARVIAEHQHELPRLFKRYQIQPVWRADRPARGRFREFYQCDIDAVGSTSPLIEVELLAAVCDVMAALGFDDFIMRLNHRQILGALLANARVPEDRREEVLVALDKLDKVGRDGVAAELAGRGLAADVSGRILDWVQVQPVAIRRAPARAAGTSGSLDGLDHQVDSLDRLEHEFSVLDDPGRAAFETMRQIFRLSADTSAGCRLRFDPSLARGLSYYTGAIMEMAVPDLAGSLGAGGRYDNLIGMFLGREVPACGFSLGLERILVVMAERKMFPPSVVRGALDVVVTVWSQETRADSVALAAELRRAGLRAEVYPDADKIGRQFKYASSRGAPWVAVLGDDERARGEVAIKNMTSGEQQSVPRSEAARFIDAHGI